MPKTFHFHTNTYQLDEPLRCANCKFIKANGEQCKNRVCIGLPYCHIHKKIMQLLKVNKSLIPNAGLGLFAHDGSNDKRKILFKNGDIITVYYGELIGKKELENRYDIFTAPYAIENRKNRIYEDGALFRGVGSIINHHPKKANCRISIGRNNKSSIVARKNIRNGDELYINYGKEYKFNEKGVKTSTNDNKYKV